jgi:Bacterial Ig-like domain (group 3)/Immunoglobulin I-set domain
VKVEHDVTPEVRRLRVKTAARSVRYATSILLVLLVSVPLVLVTSPQLAFAGGAVEFAGTLVDPSGVPQANVGIVLTDSSGDTFTGATGADGSFTVTTDPANYQLQLSGTYGGSGFTLQGSVNLTNGSLTNETLTMPAQSVSVSDGSGNPVANATVTETEPGSPYIAGFNLSPDVVISGGQYSGAPSPRTGTLVESTDSSGHASFDEFLLAPCASVGDCQFNGQTVPTFLVTAQNYWGSPDGVSSSDGSPIDVTLYQSTPNFTFSGNLVDQFGNPLSGTITLLNGTTNATYSATVGPDGSFSVSAEQDPNFNLTIDVPGSAGSTIEVAGGLDLLQSDVGQTLTLPLTTERVQVNDSSGKPVDGATVATSEACGTAGYTVVPGDPDGGNEQISTTALTATTDATGATAPWIMPECQSMQNGPSAVVVQPPSGSNFATANASGPNSLTGPAIVNVVMASFSGSLEDSNSQALTDQTLEVLTSSGAQVAQTTTGSSGAFALTVPPGTYTVAASGSLGDPTQYSIDIPNVALTSAKSGTLVLPTESVTVSVVGPGGVPVSGATIQLACTATSFPLLGGNASGTECSTEQTGTNGQSHLVLLPSGGTSLVVTPPSGSGLESKSVAFVPGNGVSVSVALSQVPVSAPSIETQPINQSVHVGQTASFTASASGSPTPTVQWQISTDGGSTYTSVPGATLPTYPFTASGSQNGDLFRAVFSNGVGSPATTNPATLTVNKTAPVISWAPASITYGQGLTASQLDATSSVPGTFVYSQPVGALLGVGVHRLSVKFTPTDKSTYLTVTDSASLSVIRATPNITWANPATIAYPTALSSTQLDAAASVAGTFAYSPPAGTVLAAGKQTLSVLFTPADNTDYKTVTATVTQLVAMAATTTRLTLTTPVSYGAEASAALSLTVGAAGGVTPTGTVSVTAKSASNVVTTLCTVTLATGSGTCTLTSNRLPAGSYTITAAYAASTDFLASSKSRPLVISQAATTLAASSIIIPATGAHTITFSATLKSLVTNTGLAGQHVVFTLGAQTCTSTTANSGFGSCTMSVLSPAPGSYSVSYAATVDYQSSSATRPVT